MSKNNTGSAAGQRLPVKTCQLTSTIYTQRKTNEWIREKLSEDRQLLNIIKIWKIRYYGHVTRKTSCLENVIVQGSISGSRSRGRQRRRWTEDIVDWTGLDINTAERLTADRYRWHHVLLTAGPTTTTILTAIYYSQLIRIGLHSIRSEKN